MKVMSKILAKGILFLVYAVVISCATTNREDLAVSAEQRAENKISNTRLEEQFYTDQPGADVLEAFGVSAISKLKDCYEYLQVISNQQYDTTFRKQAMAQVRTLFSDSSAVPFTGLDNVPDLLPAFLDRLYQGEWEEPVWQVSGIMLRKLPEGGASTAFYKGQLTYRLTLNGESVSENPVVQNIIVRKTLTDFGSETAEVWKVFLDK